jgi:NADH-quinone oxidoreductase subunit C
MPALTFEQIRERLAARFGAAVGPTVEARDPFVVVEPARLLEIARFLRDEPELALDYLVDETAVDYPAEGKLRLVYHLWSTRLRQGFKLKVELARAAPEVDSLDPVWPAANWLEREVYDLFGVRFCGHPDLRRLLMPEDWPGHPMLKDWQEQGGYRGIGNTRVSALERLPELDARARAAAPPPEPEAAAEPAAGERSA